MRVYVRMSTHPTAASTIYPSYFMVVERLPRHHNLSLLVGELTEERGRERWGGESYAPERKESEITKWRGGEIKDDFYFLYLEESSLPGRGVGAERCQLRIMTCLTDRETHTKHQQTHNTFRLKHTEYTVSYTECIHFQIP